jgi:hypothetical protein
LGWTKEKGLSVMMFNDKLGQTQVGVEQKDNQHQHPDNN